MTSAERVSSNYEVMHDLLANDSFFVERTNHENAEESSDEGIEKQEDLKEMSETEALFTGEISADDVEENQREEHLEKGEKAEHSKRLQFNRKDDLNAPVKGGVSIESDLKVTLQAPQISFGKGFTDTDVDDMNIIAILGRVMALCAMTGVQFQKNIWEQATSNMMQSINLAPSIAEAVYNTADEQAKATEAEASMSKSDGITNLAFSGFSFVMGFKETFFGKDAAAAVGTNAIDNAANRGAQGGANAAEGAAGRAAAGAAEEVAQADAAAVRQAADGAGPAGPAVAAEADRGAGAAARGRVVNAEANAAAAGNARPADAADPAADPRRIVIEPAAQPAAAAPAADANPRVNPNANNPAAAGANGRRLNVAANAAAAAGAPNEVKGYWGRFVENFKSFGGKTYQAFLKSFNMAQGMSMMAMGINGVANDAPGKTNQANHQRAAGAQDANSKMGEMLAQFENQAFQRAEDIRQSGRQSGIDNPCNVWKQAADTVTQAVLAQHA